MNARLIFVHAVSPLHAGTGQGVGVIDLPIAREKATGLPFLPGSSLKGTLRDSCASGDTRLTIFGPDTTNAEDYAGAAQFSDQRLLLLPVRSLAGTFAWVTSPYLLRRFARDARDARAVALPATIPEPASVGQCGVVAGDCDLVIAGSQRRLILEDLDLEAMQQDAVTQWARWIGESVFPDDTDWQGMLSARFCVVHDDVLNFLLETATEITARVKLIENAKTVQKGGLWYEEALPTETVLAGLVVATPVEKRPIKADDLFDELRSLTRQTLQFGGKATVGRGLCRVQIAALQTGGR